MGWIAFLVLGGLAGWLASNFMNKRQGLLMNILVGVVGAIIGGWLGGVVGIAATTFVGQLLIATAGAVILLWVLGKLKS